MTITYTWAVKNLNSDMRGYAVTAFFEMQGVDETGKTATGSVSVCFGAEDMKPMSQWTQEAIDAYAEAKREYIEQLILEKFAK
jgi:hypothetical protein